MSSRLRSLSVRFVVALSLLVQSAFPFGVLADSRTRPVTQALEEAAEYNRLIQQGYKVPAGQPQGSFGPDRFLLLEQEVNEVKYVGRSFSLFKSFVTRELRVHDGRMDRVQRTIDQIDALLSAQLGDRSFSNPCAEFPSDDARFDRKLVLEQLVRHLNEGRKKDTAEFVWNSRTAPAELACYRDIVKSIQAEWTTQLDQIRASEESLRQVPNVTQAEERELHVWHNWWDVSVELYSKTKGEPVENLPMANSADRHAIRDTGSALCPAGEECEIVLKNGSLKLNTLHIPVKAITTFGPYVVFVHPDSYDAAGGVQYLSFLDLASFGPLLGHEEIPVMRLPIVADKPVETLEVRNKRLILNGDKKISAELFMAVAELERVGFNITANVVAPEDIADVIPYLDSLQEYFTKFARHEIVEAKIDRRGLGEAQVLFTRLGGEIQKQIEENKTLGELVGGKKKPVNAKDVEVISAELKQVLTNYTEQVAPAKKMEESAKAITTRLTLARGLKARTKMFMNKILSPVPNASLKIKRALVMLGQNRNIKQGGFWSFLLDRPWLHVTAIAAGGMIGLAPEAFLDLVETGVAFGVGTLDYLRFAALGLGEAIGAGTAATLAPFTTLGGAVWDQYVADGNLAKTMVGLAVFVPSILSTFYIPHMIFNLHRIYLDSRKPDWNGFVDHQRKFIREYYERLAQDEAKRRDLGDDEKVVSFSEEEEAEIQAFVAARKETSSAYAKPGLLGRFWRGTKNGFSKLTSVVTRSKAVAEGGDHDKVRGFWSALASVTFSYPAMELTLGRWTRVWNWFAGTRFSSVGFLTLRDIGLKYRLPIFPIRLKPISAGTRLLFPDFFSTVVAKRGPKLTQPTELNGGTRGWEYRDWLWIKEGILGKPSAVQDAEDEMERQLTRSEMKVMTEDFEKKIAEVEDGVYKAAFTAAIRRLPDFISDHKELSKLFVDKPLKSVVEKRVRDLPVRIRTFLRLYVERIYGAAMSDFLNEKLRAEGEGGSAETLSLGELKERMLDERQHSGNRTEFQFDATAAVAKAEAYGKDEELFQKAARRAWWGELAPGNFIMNRKYNLISDMDPQQNPSMERYGVVQERLKSPNAFARAVRSEISKLLITFPLDLGFKLLFSAAIYEGAFKPIQDHFWGPNSIAYLSSTSFYMITMSGFVMSMMADAWVKIQQDARQDDLGEFGKIPRGEDAEKGFFRWYMKQFNGKTNSLWANWAYNNYIAFWNLPAALANIGLFYFMFSGRIDLSLMFAGYAVIFGTPLGAVFTKVEQAFERSVEYAARGVKDESWMAHPAIQELIAKEKQHYRNRFQFLADIYGNVQGSWQTNVEVIPTSLGTRGFVRALLGGALLEEAIVNNVLRPVKKAVRGIPVVDQVVGSAASICEHLLTNGNTDLRIKRR